MYMKQPFYSDKEKKLTPCSLSDQDVNVTHKRVAQSSFHTEHMLTNYCLNNYVITETQMVCRPNSLTVTLIKNNDVKFHLSVNG